MMKMLRYIALAITVIMFVYQIADAGWFRDTVRGNGKMTSKELPLEEFVEVMFATQGTAYIESGTENKIIIEGEENIIEHLEVEVRNGILSIETADGYSLRPRESLTFRVTAAQSIEQLTTASSGDIVASRLNHDRVIVSVLSSGSVEVDDVGARTLELAINSSGELRVRNLKCEILEARINSSGSIILHGGAAAEQDIRINSSGDYRALKVESEDAYVKINSSGNVHINVADYLRVSSNSSGDVRLIGNPRIDSNMNSSGRIERASI